MWRCSVEAGWKLLTCLVWIRTTSKARIATRLMQSLRAVLTYLPR